MTIPRLHSWFSRVVVEGESARLRSDDVDESESESESDNEGESAAAPGETYRVGGGKVVRINGMAEYVRKAEASAAKAMKATPT